MVGKENYVISEMIPFTGCLWQSGHPYIHTNDKNGLRKLYYRFENTYIHASTYTCTHKHNNNKLTERSCQHKRGET